MKRSSLLFVIILTITFIKIDAKISKTESIISGDEAREGWFKYHVSVQVNNTHRCGGAAIGSKFVLTAALCFLHDVTGNLLHMHFSILVAFNSLSPSENSQRIDITKVYLHISYIPHVSDSTSVFSTGGDLAIAELQAPFSMANNVNVKLLQIPKNFTHWRKTFIITGHGFHKYSVHKNETTGQETPYLVSDGNLRFAKTRIMTTIKCEDLYEHPIHNSKFCASVAQLKGAGPRGVCGGDSGSPLVYKNEIVYGILVGGASMCDETVLPAIYTRVTYYRKFILDILSGDINRVLMHILTLVRNSSTGEYAFVED